MKRCAAFLTAFFVMMFSVGVCAASFSDMPSKDSEYYDALNYAVTHGYLTGSDGKILPNDNVTRAQAAAIFVRVAKLTDKANLSNVPDVISDAWYYDVMACAVKAGLFTARDGKLYPDSDLTRAEAFVLVYKAQLTSFAGEPASLEDVRDISSLSSDAKTALSVLLGANVLTLSSGKAEPDKSITRAELALWIYNASKAAVTTVTEASSEEATEAASETPSEEATEAATESTYSQQASEAMQLALGILADGTSYITTSPIYHDGMTIVWNTGGSTKTSSSSSSGGSSSGGSSSGGSSSGSSGSDDDSSSSTEAATSATEKETEPEETYTGTITNDNDNVVEDPFADSDDDEDDEDDDFVIDDDDYEYEKPTEAETDSETETETETETEEASSDIEEETVLPTAEDETEEETSAPEDASEPEEETDSAEENEGEAADDTPTIAAFFSSKKDAFLLSIKRTDLA